jgi:membrane associated rhomboid family serine protease
LTAQATTCYRHPDQETGVRCQRCERPICPLCMVPAPVGVQCVECVHRLRSPAPAGRRLGGSYWTSVTGLLLAANVGAWALGLVLFGPGALFSSPLAGVGGLEVAAVAAGEWWRILTSGFLHVGLIHLGMNMIALVALGPALERELGRARFAALYLVGLVTASLGPVLVGAEGATVGASGAIFALIGAIVVGQRASGVDPWRSGILGLLALNLVFTFVVPGISIGGHLGGLVGGLLAGLVLFNPRLPPALATLACLGLAAAAAAATMWVASHPLPVHV